MKFGSYHTFQVSPGMSQSQVYADEFERIRLAEDLGFDSVWVPEQHFFDYCGCPDAITMATHVVGMTTRVRVGTAVVNLSLTHPLRFAERALLLDRLSGGRVDLCVGRGYQWPQNVVMGVDEADTKAQFEESLDIVLNAWDTEPAGYDGKFYDFPPIRVYPEPLRPAGDVLLYAVGGTTPLEATVARGLPLALSQPFLPIEKTAETFRRYVDLVEASNLDADKVLDRSIVVLYSMIAPSKDEARTLAKKPFEWHMSRLNALRQPLPEGQPWESLSQSDNPPEIADDDYAKRTESMLAFDDPAGFAEKVDVLRQAGVRCIIPWMGAGGVAQEHILRAFRLLASDVMPRFA